MKFKHIFLFSSIFFVSVCAFAGGSIFGGHKTRTSNPNGVSSIGIHICGSLNCPSVIIKNGDCGTVKHATTKYGVCVCDDGYEAKDGKCVSKGSQQQCEDGYIVREGECVPDGSDCLDSDCCNQAEGNWVCSVYSPSVCVCVPDGYTSDCSDYYCKACSPSEGTALCPGDGECICVPEGYSSDCSKETCKSCSPEEGTALCPSVVGECICVPDGYSSGCNAYTCKACSPEEGTAECEGDEYCYCEAPHCPTGQTEVCSDEGECICVPEGYSSACDYEFCEACSPEEGTAKCDNTGCHCEIDCTTNAGLCASWQKCEEGICVCDSTKISNSNSPCPTTSCEDCKDSGTMICECVGPTHAFDYSICSNTHKTKAYCRYHD